MAASSSSCPLYLTVLLPTEEPLVTIQNILVKDLIGLVLVRCPSLDQSTTSMGIEHFAQRQLFPCLEASPRVRDLAAPEPHQFSPWEVLSIALLEYTIWWLSASTNPWVGFLTVNIFTALWKMKSSWWIGRGRCQHMTISLDATWSSGTQSNWLNKGSISCSVSFVSVKGRPSCPGGGLFFWLGQGRAYNRLTAKKNALKLGQVTKLSE